MADSYSQLHIQYIFSVRNRDCILLPEWRTDLFEYISGIVRKRGQKPIITGGYFDHIHLLVGIRPDMRISDLIRDVKNISTNFMNNNKFIGSKFSWQEGYGVFSYSKSQIETVYNYILNQGNHHKKKTFKEEYLKILKDRDMDYKEEFLFKWIDC